MSNKPALRIKGFHGLSASIWRNLSSEQKVYFTFKIERTVKDGDGFKSYTSFSADQAAEVARLSNKVADAVLELLADERDNQVV